MILLSKYKRAIIGDASYSHGGGDRAVQTSETGGAERHEDAPHLSREALIEHTTKAREIALRELHLAQRQMDTQGINAAHDAIKVATHELMRLEQGR